MAPLKILFIYDCVYPDAQGGVEHRNLCMARALAERGHFITIAGWFKTEPPPYPRITYRRLPFSAPLYDDHGKRTVLTSLRFALACLLLNVHGFDVVETANIPYLHLFPLGLKTRGLGVPLLVTWYEFFGDLWGQYKNKKVAPFFTFIEKLSLKAGDAICAISPLTINKIIPYWLGKTPPALLPCGVDLAQIHQAAERPSSCPPLVFAGRLIPEKRVDLLLQAIALLPSNDKEPILSIIGDGPDRSRLETIVKALRLETRVVFAGKLPTILEVWQKVAGARVAVQPSAREGFGLFPLEALALGKPVIYCDSPDNAICQVVRHDIEGYCCSATPEALAEAIHRLLTTPSLWDRLHHSALARAALFDWDFLAHDMETMVYRMLGYDTPSPPRAPSDLDRAFDRDTP